MKKAEKRMKSLKAKSNRVLKTLKKMAAAAKNKVVSKKH